MAAQEVRFAREHYCEKMASKQNAQGCEGRSCDKALTISRLIFRSCKEEISGLLVLGFIAVVDLRLFDLSFYIL